MFIKESLRMYPPVPAIGRELEGPLDVRSSLNKPQNCSFASKTSVFLLIFTLHRNPLLWKNPEVSYGTKISSLDKRYCVIESCCFDICSSVNIFNSNLLLELLNAFQV